MTVQQQIDQTTATAQASRPLDRPLNPFRFPSSVPARELVASVIDRVDAQMNALKPRKRQRKAADRATLEATVMAVISDLLHQCLEGDPRGVSLSRSNSWPPSRYRLVIHNKMLPAVLDAMAEGGLGYLDQRVGRRAFEGDGYLTSLLPTTKLRDMAAAARLTSEDIGVEPGGEVIHLLGRKVEFEKAPLVDYAETAQTQQFRVEMLKINEWLAGADLSLDEDHLPPGDLFPDLSDRWQIRRFTKGSFDTGGRLWGGFWQGMKKAARREGLMIDGEPVAELDFGQAGVRILYGLAGEPVPNVDLYAVPGFERHRELLKKAMSAMSFADWRLQRMLPGMKPKLGKGHTMPKVVKAVESFHRPIAHMFFVGAGHRAQRIESDIIVATLLRLVDQGVTALPIHDAVMVSRSAAQAAGEVMLDVFRELAGVEGKLSSYPADVLEVTSSGEA